MQTAISQNPNLQHPNTMYLGEIRAGDYFGIPNGNTGNGSHTVHCFVWGERLGKVEVRGYHRLYDNGGDPVVALLPEDALRRCVRGKPNPQEQLVCKALPGFVFVQMGSESSAC